MVRLAGENLAVQRFGLAQPAGLVMGEGGLNGNRGAGHAWQALAGKKCVGDATDAPI
jgi:hypothetical protein